MLPILRQLLILVFFILSGFSARAQSLVQLSLEGAISPEGGAMVEILWESTFPDQEPRAVNLRLHLAQGTSAHDLGQLLSQRLKAQNIAGIFPGPSAPKSGATHVFVNHTSVLRLRLPPGLSSKVTACESAPTRVRVLRADAFPGSGSILTNTTTLHPHTHKTGRVLVSTEFTAQESPDAICERLFVQGLAKDLVVDRPTQDSWRPIRGNGGTVVAGCSIELKTPGTDWGLELRMGSAVR